MPPLWLPHIFSTKGLIVPDGAALVGMTVVALGMVLTPGPNMMYLVSRSISQGRNEGLISLSGTGAGFLIWSWRT